MCQCNSWKINNLNGKNVLPSVIFYFLCKHFIPLVQRISKIIHIKKCHMVAGAFYMCKNSKGLNIIPVIWVGCLKYVGWQWNSSIITLIYDVLLIFHQHFQLSFLILKKLLAVTSKLTIYRLQKFHLRRAFVKSDLPVLVSDNLMEVFDIT